MNTFSINLSAATRQQTITGVTSFIGEDASGFFGIQAHHARFMTTLVFGLARFRLAAETWQYLALPGAVLYFHNNELTLSCQQFFLDSDLARISTLLQQQFSSQENTVQATKESLGRMEQNILKRLMSLQRKTMWQS